MFIYSIYARGDLQRYFTTKLAAVTYGREHFTADGFEMIRHDVRDMPPRVMIVAALNGEPWEWGEEIIHTEEGTPNG